MYLYSGFQIRLCLQMHFMYVFVKVSLSVYMQSQFSVQFAKRNYFNMSHHLFQIYITAEKKNLDKHFFFFFLNQHQLFRLVYLAKITCGKVCSAVCLSGSEVNRDFTVSEVLLTAPVGFTGQTSPQTSHLIQADAQFI